MIWKRLKSGVFTQDARSYIYLIIHERVGTRERGNRLMPGRFSSPLCNYCDQPETIEHRYSLCFLVSDIWGWLLTKLWYLDNSLMTTNNTDILSLAFPRSLRDNALLWMIGIYVEIVEREVVMKGVKLSLAQIQGIFKEKKLKARHQALPDLGIIAGVDFDPQGIG